MKVLREPFTGTKSITGYNSTCMKPLQFLFLLISLLTASLPAAEAQPALQNDYSYTMELPSVAAMESSAAHLYVLSASDGMAVFRTRRDSMQWLYTAPGMQQRGHTLRADIRFAYLFGNGRRLTVLEPTSVMGAFSSTSLAAPPLDAVRVDDVLYVALGGQGLGRLSLESPEALDSDAQFIQAEGLQNRHILDLELSAEKLYALAQNRLIFVFNKTGDGITLNKTIATARPLEHIFYLHNTLMGTDREGTIYEIDAGGGLAEMGSIGEPVTEMKYWNDWLLIQGESNRLWSSYQLTEPSLWKRNGEAGNYLALSKGQLWISEYGRISRIHETNASVAEPSASAGENESDGPFELQPVGDQIVPYPHAVLIPLKIRGLGSEEVRFSLQTNAENAKIRGRSFYWKPPSRNAGSHRFKIIASGPDGATSTTTFNVEVTPFNSPPRFTPMRSISIPAERPFTLPVSAIDPDGTNKNLVRYLGDNLPSGASIDAATGKFSWTPTARQVGEHAFRIIATDQYGAASSVDMTIRVIDTGNRQN